MLSSWYDGKIISIFLKSYKSFNLDSVIIMLYNTDS